MCAAIRVVRHDLSEEYLWPQHVANIFDQLSRPLPKYLASDVFQTALPSSTREMLQVALQSPTVALEDAQDAYNEDGRPVTDVVDSVLSSVRMVKAASSFGRRQKQARLSWTSLIGLLGITMSEDVFIAEDVPFLMPRTKEKLEPKMAEDLEGKAAILLSIFIPRTIIQDKDVKHHSEDTEPSSSPSSDCRTSESSPSDRPFEILQVPLDGHVTVGSGKRVDCRLPVVSAADEDEIEGLVTSVVCQRFVWNIPLPVIGFSLSASGSTAQLVVGWSECEEKIPVIHLAYLPQERVPRPSLGLFDLLDPASALYFGQFILRLQGHFTSVKEGSMDRRTRDFCWRLDHANDSHSFHTYEDCPYVENWLHGLPLSGNSDSSRKSSRLLRVPSPSPTPSVSGNNDSRSGHSASAFADLKNERGLAAMEPGTDTWLWERRTLRLFRVKLLNGKSGLFKQINDMIDLYDLLTEFSWPEEWAADGFAPPYCDAPCIRQRNNLFQAYKEFSSNRQSTPKLEAGVTASVVNHMTTFLKAIENAQITQIQARLSGTSESAMRSAWDELLKATCCSPTEILSKTFFLEKTISLPQNKLLATSQGFNDVFQSQLLYLLLSLQVGSPHDGTAAVHHGLSQGVHQAWLNVERSQSKSKSAVPDRSFEPASARVDGVYCFEFLVDKQPRTVNLPQKPKKGWLSSFLAPFKRQSKKSSCPKGEVQTFVYKEPYSKKEKRLVYNDAHTACLMCPEVTESLPDPSPFSVEEDDFLRLYLPFIFVENKRATTTLRQAFHQAQMYCIFGVEFLAALGITDFPVFGIVAAATEGEIIMAWKSSKSVKEDYEIRYRQDKESLASATTNGCTFLIDQNCKKFDLSSPLQAFHFFISVHRIFKRQELLAEMLDGKSAESVLDSSSALSEWMMPPKVREKKSRLTSCQPEASTSKK